MAYSASIKRTLEKAAKWARAQGLHDGCQKNQIKKIAEELTEAMVHLSTDKSIDDDVGDILIATNTYLLQVWGPHYIVDIDIYVRQIKSAYTEAGARCMTSDEWFTLYLQTMRSLYEGWVDLTSICRLAGILARERSELFIGELLENCYREIRDRTYTQPPVKKVLKIKIKKKDVDRIRANAVASGKTVVKPVKSETTKSKSAKCKSKQSKVKPELKSGKTKK